MTAIPKSDLRVLKARCYGSGAKAWHKTRLRRAGLVPLLWGEKIRRCSDPTSIVSAPQSRAHDPRRSISRPPNSQARIRRRKSLPRRIRTRIDVLGALGDGNRAGRCTLTTPKGDARPHDPSEP